MVSKLLGSNVLVNAEIVIGYQFSVRGLIVRYPLGIVVTELRCQRLPKNICGQKTS